MGIDDRSKDWNWPLWPIVPLYPYGQRRTLRREVVREQVWVFEQIQGIFYVTVPIRMTVIRLEAGGLLIYAPVAPTGECLALLRDLTAQYGDVQFIVFSTASGIEHKVFVPPFAQRFPQAKIIVVPHTWSFPLNLPLPWLGLPQQRTQVLSEQQPSPLPPEFDWAVLGPVTLGLGDFAEISLFHNPSRSLLVTDALISIPANPPESVQLDPYPLLFHARDSALEPVEDTPANRQKGWQRIVLFAFYFRPQTLGVLANATALRLALRSPDQSRRNYFGWLPWEWTEQWQRSFQDLQQNGTVQVAPILQTLILNRDLDAVERWLDQVSQWPIERLIAAHLDAPVPLTPSTLRAAFKVLDRPSSNPDFQFLQSLNDRLTQWGITPPVPERKNVNILKG